MNGLVLAGGNSTRMGSDKALITYNNEPQYLHIYNLLKEYCIDVFISTQSKNYPKVSNLFDNEKYRELGPLAGILTAFDYQNTDWLVVAIDYPLITKHEIELLIETSDEMANVFYNTNSTFYEPYLGLYKSNFQSVLNQYYTINCYSLQHILKETNVKKVLTENNNVIQNINSKEEFQLFLL